VCSSAVLPTAQASQATTGIVRTRLLSSHEPQDHKNQADYADAKTAATSAAEAAPRMLCKLFVGITAAQFHACTHELIQGRLQVEPNPRDGVFCWL
jgi:hypothetical protein